VKNVVTRFPREPVDSRDVGEHREVELVAKEGHDLEETVAGHRELAEIGPGDDREFGKTFTNPGLDGGKLHHRDGPTARYPA
jgi:hypothetical protein